MKTLLLTVLILFLSFTALPAGEKSYKLDLDMDGNPELITVRQKFLKRKDGSQIPTKAEVTVFNTKGKPSSFFIPDKMEKLEFIGLNKDGNKQIVAWSYGERHYNNIAIYRYKYGKLYELFKNGSPFPIKADFKTDKPLIKVGRANLETKSGEYKNSEPLWQVYLWDGRKFVYNKKLSTTPEISEAEEAARYLNKVKDLTDKLYKQINQLTKPEKSK